MPREVIQRDRQVFAEYPLLPPGRGVGDLVIGKAEDHLETRAEPLVFGVLQVPVPKAVERARLQELEDSGVLLKESVKRGFEIVLRCGAVRRRGCNRSWK